MTLFIKQNNWHRYGVFIHTWMVVYHALRAKEYKMITAGFLHDIAKPLVAYRDEEDKITGEYSFTNHEELSYQVIKNWFFISEYTKRLVRYHFLIRGMEISQKKGQAGRYNRMKRIYDNLDKDFVEDLKRFLKYDDLAKV
jgi:hypothetical protein